MTTDAAGHSLRACGHALVPETCYQCQVVDLERQLHVHLKQMARALRMIDKGFREYDWERVQVAYRTIADELSEEEWQRLRAEAER